MYPVRGHHSQKENDIDKGSGQSLSRIHPAITIQPPHLRVWRFVFQAGDCALMITDGRTMR